MVKIEIDLEKDKDFVDQVKSKVIVMIASMLHNDDKKTSDVTASAISRYFERNHGSIEKFTRSVIVNMISEILGDNSTMPNDDKAKNIIVSLLKQSINDIVREKFKNVKITGIE